MFRNRRLDLIIICLTLQFSYPTGLVANQNRMLPVLGMNLIALGSPVLLLGFGGYGIFSAAEKRALPEMEKKGLELVEQFEGLKNKTLGPSTIPLDSIPINEWINRSGYKIAEIIKSSLSDAPGKTELEFLELFFKLTKVRAAMLSEEGLLPGTEIDVLRISQSRKIILDKLEDPEVFFYNLLGITAGKFDFFTMLQCDRLIIDYNKKQIGEIDTKLEWIDVFAILEKKEDHLYAQAELRERKISAIDAEANSLREAIGYLEDGTIQSMYSEAFQNISLGFKEFEILQKVVVFQLEQYETKLNSLRKRKAILLLNQSDAAPSMDTLQEMELKEKEIDRAYAQCKELQKSLKRQIDVHIFEDIELLIPDYKKFLQKSLESLLVQKDQSNLQILDKVEISPLEEIKIEQEKALEKLAGSSYSSLYQEILEALQDKSLSLLVLDQEEGTETAGLYKIFSSKRAALQKRKSDIDEFNWKLRSLYYDAMEGKPLSSGQAYVLSLVEQINECVKNIIFLETAPRLVDALKQSTKEGFLSFGPFAGSERIAREIAIPVESSFKNAIYNLSFKNYQVLGWFHNPLMSIVDSVSVDSLAEVISSSIKSVEMQLSDTQFIDSSKEHAIANKICAAIHPQMDRFVDRTKKIVFFESLYLANFTDEQQKSWEDFAKTLVGISAENQTPHLNMLNRLKKSMIVIGLAGTTLMVSGSSLVYFGSSSLPS